MPPAFLPSRQFLSVWAAATRLLLALLLSGWLLLALGWALLHGWIVPRVGEFRPQLQQLVGRATGLQVEIGELSARSTGVFPSFELSQVRLLDAEGRPALELPQVLIALSPRSVMTLGLEQLVIRGASLDVRLDDQGRLWLAGLPLSNLQAPQDDRLAEWLFSQKEWALLDGTVRWHDVQRGVELALTQVDAVMRNPGQQHNFRIDATPPEAWGERFSLRGQFRQPLLVRADSDWRRWSGQVYAQFSRIDLSPLQPYAQLAEVSLDRGRGALRAWLDIAEGRLQGMTSDVMLEDAQGRLAPELQPLAFRHLAGRLAWQMPAGKGLELQTESLSLATDDGLHWPGGQVALSLGLDAQGNTTRGQLKAEQLDLQALAAVSGRLPLAPAWQDSLRSLAPQGRLEQLEASWQGPLAQPRTVSARGRVRALSLAADGGGGRRPGVSGLALDFRLQREGDEDRAQASFSLNQGWLEFPGIFQEPRLPLDSLAGELRVRRDTRGTEVELRQVTLQSADAQGQFQGSWKRAAGGDALGSLDLQGQLSRGDGARVWRYLPLGIAEKVRDYVRTSVTQGQLSDVRFKVKGPLTRFPFESAREGDFQISGKLRNASYAYVPAPSPARGGPPWPALQQLEAELLFSRDSLQILKGQARVAGHPGLALSRTEARIASLLRQPVVEVSGNIKGPMAQALALVQHSPLAAMTGQALAEASATGPADVQLRLSLPLDDLARSKVRGSVVLAGNDLQLAPEAPPMGRVRGTVSFTENSFLVSSGQARMLGGELRFDGGMKPVRSADEPEVVFTGQGTASVEGLQQWRELSDWAPLLSRASGSTAYSATVGFHRGALELSIGSSLAGLALALPEPLAKPAAATLPLRLDKTVLRESLGPGRRLQDRISLSLGAGTPRPVWASYTRDIAGAQAQVLRGQLGVGLEREGEAGEREVSARLQLPRLDLDAWSALVGTGQAEEAAVPPAALGYLPTVLNLRTGALTMQGHTFQDVVLGARREGGLWRATVAASELSGQAEYRLPTGGAPGRLHARLSRLSLGAGAASEMEALLDRQPHSIPALDIVVDELELRGKKLGRLEVEAVNRHMAGREATREWRLARLQLSVPEATLSATGSWAAPPGAGPGQRAAAPRRGTQLQFRLDVADSGELLRRLGLDGAIRRGKGRLEGQIGWNGSPLALHHPSLAGQLSIDMESGQFLKAEPGAAKLLGVLNLQALPRRLSLDFRDVFSEGFAFDSVRGQVAIQQGVASTSDLRMRGVNAAVLMEGSADIARETQDLRVVVVPELNAGTASLLTYAVNPALGLSTFVAQWLLRQPLNQAATQEFQISGTWKDPQIQRVPRQRPSAEGRP